LRFGCRWDELQRKKDKRESHRGKIFSSDAFYFSPPALCRFAAFFLRFGAAFAPASKEDLQIGVNLGEPELVEVTLFGAVFEVPAEITVYDQRGKIDFLTFKDFRVNGMKVEIEEYRESFEIEKNKPLRLTKPIRIFVSTAQAVRGGLKDSFQTDDQWQVSGRIFIFGKFKKMGFNFKRVVPVDVELEVANPLKSDSTN
jgi:hypothetical protein